MNRSRVDVPILVPLLAELCIYPACQHQVSLTSDPNNREKDENKELTEQHSYPTEYDDPSTPGDLGGVAGASPESSDGYGLAC